MKGLLENHLNVAALDNDETNKRLTFLFRFEEEFRIPLVKRQRFNSSEAEGLLVIRRGCCQCSTNGHGTGFPSTLPALWHLRKPRTGRVKGGCFKRLGVGLGDSAVLPCEGFPLWEGQRAVFLGGTEWCKPHKPTLELSAWAPPPLVHLPTAGAAAAQANALLHAEERLCKWAVGQESPPWNRALGRQIACLSLDSSPQQALSSHTLSCQDDFYIGFRGKEWKAAGQSASPCSSSVPHNTLISLAICFCSVFCIFQEPGTATCRAFCLKEVKSCLVLKVCWMCTYSIPTGSIQWTGAMPCKRDGKGFLFACFERSLFQKRKLE